jgi:quercetin dioxygenase-like cupin family protein
VKAFRIDDVRAAGAAAGRLYEEFLRERSMSVGLYELPAGAIDPQRPHAQDELYVVTEGRATFWCDGETHPVRPGSVIFVPAGAPHRFVDITADLSVLVVFAPPEGAA